MFEVSNYVWAFLTKDRMPSHAYNKLKNKKIGPLIVLECINDNTYRLQLPAHINMSDVFSVHYFRIVFLQNRFLIWDQIFLIQRDLMQHQDTFTSKKLLSYVRFIMISFSYYDFSVFFLLEELSYLNCVSRPI